jgi:Heme/copper-type cytochrome/quinol oxidases, subunit 1
MILETILHLVFGKLSLDALPSDPITSYGAGGVLFSGLFVVLATLTYFKKWKYLWTEWICTVDHKRIGIMYVILAFVMFLLEPWCKR